MPYADPEKARKHQREYYQKHSEERKQYLQRPEIRERNRKWRKEYKRKYYQTYREQLIEKTKIYAKNHSEQIKERNKRYYQNHKEQIKERVKDWAKTHNKNRRKIQKIFRLKHREQLIEYYSRPEVKEWKKDYSKEYYKHPEVKIRHRIIGRINSRKYRHQNPEKFNERARKWRKTHPEKAKEVSDKSHSKRRKLGFIPLNKPFTDSEAHHIDEIHVVYIPHYLHCSVYHVIWTGRGMTEINDKVFEWLNNQRLEDGSIQTNLPKLEAQPLNSTTITVIQEL